MSTYKSIKYTIPTEVVEHTDSINALSDVDTATTAPTDGQVLLWNATNSKWYPGDAAETAVARTQKAIFSFGDQQITNLVSSSGVVATDVTGVGYSRYRMAACSYGGDKAIFGFGNPVDIPGVSDDYTNITNLVSNVGVVGSDQTGVGTPRNRLAAAGYGGDKGLFGFGWEDSDEVVIPYGQCDVTNKVSNTGVVQADTTGVGMNRSHLAATGYGGDKAIFGFGLVQGIYYTTGYTNVSNLVSNTGVVATDSTGVGSTRYLLAAATYGEDKAIFGFGKDAEIEYYGSAHKYNLVSNTGVVSVDQTGVGTCRKELAAASYGGDKAIFGYGWDSSDTGYGLTNATNLVSNTGVVSLDQTGVGTARVDLAAAGYSQTA